VNKKVTVPDAELSTPAVVARVAKRLGTTPSAPTVPDGVTLAADAVRSELNRL